MFQRGTAHEGAVLRCASAMEKLLAR